MSGVPDGQRTSDTYSRETVEQMNPPERPELPPGEPSPS